MRTRRCVASSVRSRSSGHAKRRPFPGRGGAALRSAPRSGPNRHCAACLELKFAHAPSVSRAGAKRPSRYSPRPMRGTTRRKAQSSHCRGGPAPCDGRLPSARRLSARHRGFSVRGTALPGTGKISSGLSPAFSRTRPAVKQQSPVVGPDGYPRPPESVAANHGRGRRIQLHSQNASRSAPREQDGEEYSQENFCCQLMAGAFSR